MPLQFDNEEHKRRVLQLKGFDPDRFDVDVNSGNVVPRQQTVAPAPQLAPKPVTADIKQPKVSIGKSAAIGAATGILPAAGGLATMGALQGPILGISAATGPAAPLTYAGLNIAAAIGGGSLVNWAQNKLMPESAAQAVAEAQQVNPVAFSLGNIAGQLPVMAANPKGVIEAVKTGGKVVNNLIKPSVQPLPISLAEKANLANVGVGAALPAGISGVNSLLGNEEINPKTLALEMAGGALLNRPTQLGSKLLRTPHGSSDIKPNISPEQQRVLESSTTPEKTDLKTYGKALEFAENKRLVSEGKIPEGFKVEIQIKPPEINPKKAIEDNILSPELRKVDPKGRPKMALPESGVLRQLKIKQDVVYPFKSAEESAAEMFNRENPAVRARDRLEFGGENPQGENYNKTGPESLGLPANKTPEQIASERESNYTLYRDLIRQGKLDDAMAFSKKLGEGYYFGRRYTAEKASGKPEPIEPVVEGKLTAAENQLLAARRKNFQGLSDSDIQLSAEKRLRAETEKAGNIQKLNTTKKYWDEFRSIFEPLRGIKAELDSKLKDPSTGKQVRGQIDAVRQRLKDYSVKINPNLATPDTLGHEFLHGFITDLKTSADPNQKKAVDNLLDVVSKSPEFKADNETRVKAGKKPLDAEEFLTETSGYELFNKLVNLDNQRGTYKESWRNFVGQVKAKLGKSSVEDVQRYVANRFIDDPSFNETAGKLTVAQPNDNEQRNSKGQDAEASENQRIPETSGTRGTESIEASKPEEKQPEKPAVEAKPDEVTKSDFEQYQEIQGKLREVFSREGGLDSPEFKELWQKSEDIKNRNGGHVPKKPEVKNQEVENDQTTTPEFKKWFGDSKVVDKAGKPLRVYHATQHGGFTVFKTDIEGSHFGNSEQAKYLINQKNYYREKSIDNALAVGIAESRNDYLKDSLYGDNDSTYSVYLSIKNPKRVKDVGNKWYSEVQQAKREGFDGLVYSNTEEGPGDSYVAFEPTQIKSATGNSGEFNPNNPDIRFQQSDEVQATTPEAIRANINSTIEAPAFKKSGLIRQNLGELKTRLPIFGADLDKLASRQGESGNYIAPAIKEALAKTDEYEGRWFNPSLENIKSLKYADQQLLVDTLRAEHRQGKSLRDTLPTEELKKSYDIQRELLKDKQQNQIEANQPVKEYVRGENGGFSIVPRLPKINPFYFPDIAGGKQLDIILNYEGSDAFNKLKADFINHVKNQYKFDDKVANEFFEDYRASFSRNAEATSRFGAVRKAEGVGLPDSWLEADPAVTLRRYWRRVARDRAWFDAVEKDPNNLYILNQNKDAWDKDVVPTKEGLGKIRSSQLLSDILENVHGMATKTSPKLDALVRIANNLILGPLTGVNDLLSVLPLASKFAPSITDLPRVYTEAVSTIRDGIKNAKAQGRIKEKISDVEDIWMPSTDNVERLRQIGDGIAKISGREKLEEWSRGLAQSAGESLIRIHRNSDSPKSVEFLKGLANKEDYTKMSDAQLASRIVDITQGTYDVRGLPSWAINSQVAPFFRMMKWNIEQLNNLHKHVIVPASNGNLTPLILSLTAGAVGGYVAKETREMLSGKNLHYPSLSEIANADGDKLRPITYAAAAAISYSGVLGLLGEVFKSVGDISYKNKPNAPSFPAMEVAADFVDNIFDAVQAIGQEGEDPLVVLPKLTQNLFTNNIQVGRMLLNRFGDIDDQQQRRDLRVFKQLTGRDYSPQSVPDNNNQFVGLKNKEVKKADNAAELFRATKNRVSEIISENKDNPRRLSDELKKLKTGGVTTMPSLQNSPEDFSAYYKYLVRQHGKEEADRRVAKYSKQLSLNKTRRALIPSLN